MAVSSSQEIRTCWICLGTDEDPSLQWVQPCRCRGSGKWVHQTCLLLWVDENRSSGRFKITCPLCTVEYIIIFPEVDSLTFLLQVIDGFIHKVCPVVTVGATVGFIFWAVTSYGAFTVMQICGEEEGLYILDHEHPFIVLMLLPVIPTVMFLTEVLQWEHFLLNVLRRGSKFPVLKYVLPSVAYREVMGQRVDIDPPPPNICVARVFVGALVLPTIAKIFGDVFFHTERSCLKKFFLGGLSFIAIRGMLKMYYMQQTYILQSHRRILNYNER